MTSWFKKPLGVGAQVYQSLRELRTVRYTHDADVLPDRLYVVGVDTSSMVTLAYFPPGNLHMATLVGAESCPQPHFKGTDLVLLSEEAFPILPSYAFSFPG